MFFKACCLPFYLGDFLLIYTVWDIVRYVIEYSLKFICAVK